jgi:hypothetical protein
MAKIGEYKINNLYSGGYSSFKPNYGENFTGYRATSGSLGLTTDFRTANILQDASTKFSTGVKHIELALVSPEIFDSVPKQQLKEVNRLSKLIGTEVSVHGPVIDTSGISREGGFSEINRESSERKIIETIQRSHEINPNGNILVNFHSAEGIPGTEWKKIPNEKEGFEGQAKRMIAVDRETGQLIPLEEDKKFYPGGVYGGMVEKVGNEYREVPLEKGKIHTPEEILEIHNHSKWDESLNQLIFTKERADEILRKNEFQIRHFLPELNNVRNQQELMERLEKIGPTAKDAYLAYRTAHSYLDDVNLHIKSVFSKAYEFAEKDGDRKTMDKLNEISKDYREELEKAKGDVIGESQAMKKLLFQLKDGSLAPEKFVPIEKFALNQSSKTFGNAAFEGYKKFGDTAPIVAIENPPAGFALSTGEDLKKLVVESRNQFVKKAVEEKNISESEAKRLAEKFIGATWDVGHINMLRSKGLGEEEIIKETEKIAPYLKHVHLSDNFGFEHTELPMGMGNVPFNEIMKKLGQKGYDAKKIIEAGQWWQHFKTAPMNESLEGLGAAFYTSRIAPYWNQSAGFQQGYMTGYGLMLPPVHYETFSSGFSMLPQELGGDRQQGTGGRMGGGKF